MPREPIRDSEWTEIQRSLAEADSQANVYRIAFYAASAMIEDARQTFEPTEGSPSVVRCFSNPMLYVAAACVERGLPATLKDRAMSIPELRRVAGTLGALWTRLRRLPRDETDCPVILPDELARVHSGVARGYPRSWRS